MRSVTSHNGLTVLAEKELIDELVKDTKRQRSGSARRGEVAEVGIDLSVTRASPPCRVTKAMLDRLTDQAHIIDTGDKSYRFLRTLERKQGKGAKA